MKALTKKEIAALDGAMISFGIDVPRMMELAGLFVALKAASMAGNKRKRVLVLSGSGNNGGDALVAARHLINWGYEADIAFATSVAKLKDAALHQWKILKKMKAKRVTSVEWRGYSLIIDGLLGYSISGRPRGAFAKLIERANESKVPVLAVDLPSGLDATTGEVHDPCIKAAATIALTAVKRGLLQRSAGKQVGKLFVAYMTVPEAIGKKFGVKNVFSEKKLISLLR